MNQHDKRMQWTCQIAEKDQAWYDEYFLHPNEPPAEGAAPFTATHATSANLSPDQVEKLVARDPILKSLLDVSVGARRPRSIVSKHIFHDVLLDEATYTAPKSPASISAAAAAAAAPSITHEEEASSVNVLFKDIPAVTAMINPSSTHEEEATSAKDVVFKDIQAVATNKACAKIKPSIVHEEEASSRKVVVFEGVPSVTANGAGAKIDALTQKCDDDESCMGESV